MRLVASALSEPMLDKLHSLGVMPKKGTGNGSTCGWKGDEGKNGEFLVRTRGILPLV